MRIAVLLRGIHYEEEHKTASSFTRRHDDRLYTVDYERRFKGTFDKHFLKANKFKKVDFFICSYDSVKARNLIKHYKPVKSHIYNSTKDSNQINTFVHGLKMIQEHCSKTKTKYNWIFCTRMDLKFAGNIFPLMKNNKSKAKVTVTKHLGYTNDNFCDFAHLIDPIILGRYIKHMSGEDGLRLMQCITDPIYNYYKFTKRNNNWMTIDREFVCSQYVNSKAMPKK